MTETEFDKCVESLLHPVQLWTPELSADMSRIPLKPGVYAWYFRNLEELVPATDCHSIGDWKLAYVGIAPRNHQSSRSLRTRTTNHLCGRADRSTLRLSLGAILCHKLDLHPVPKKPRKVHFGIGETELSNWMDANSALTWHVTEQPWLIEHWLIQRLSPPLNLLHNKAHPFYNVLSAARKKLRARAHAKPSN